MDSTIITPFGPLSLEFSSELSTVHLLLVRHLNLSHTMQHSNKAKELLSDHWKERVIVVQHMAGLHHNFIWGVVRRRGEGKGNEIHV